MVAGARALAKAAAERLIVSSGAASLLRSRRGEDVLVLAYHNVVPDGAPSLGDGPLHLPVSRFAAQLDLLARTHDVVPLADVLADFAGVRARGRARPRAVVTFDDAYRGALTLGVAELERRGMPATVFVAPAFVGGAAFWWDRLALDAGHPDAPRFRARALGECRGRDAEVAGLAARLGIPERAVPAYAHCAGEAELADAVSRGVIAVASHSWSHPNLALLSGSALDEELCRPLTWLRTRFAGALPVLAYPYGMVSDAVVVAARAAGYRAALRNDGGWVRAGSAIDPLRTPRVDVPAGLSLDGFALRAAGLFAA